MVTLLIGVNDQYQHLDTGGYRTRFTQLLQKAIQLAGNNKQRVFVLSIPDYSVTPFGGGLAIIRQQIDQFNAINKQITLGAGVPYINITDLSRMAASDPNLIAPDGLHPSATQYALWVHALAPVVEKSF
jgi:lysophospholipase L1-like esterase